MQITNNIGTDKIENMKLKGGVIIIGSLIWEDHLNNADNIRKDWRKQNLMDKPTLTKVPIRYGRESQTRKYTYTMVFSKSCENTLGQGLILSFNEDIVTFDGLERQAIALAIAEGIYKEDNLRLTSNWGSVGLLTNPSLKKKDFASNELIHKKWTDLYHSYQDKFVAKNYKIDTEQESVITQNGFLNIDWQEEMKDYDILIATPVIPKPKSLIADNEIAQRMIDKNYQVYFQSNKEKNITTSADRTIQQLLDNAAKSEMSKQLETEI